MRNFKEGKFSEHGGGESQYHSQRGGGKKKGAILSSIV